MPLLKTTPDILDGKEVLVNTEPPIPTPPDTVSAPVAEVVETVA